MIEVISSANRERYVDELDQIFRLRHRVFNERLGWDVASVDGRERDAFDDLDPVYLFGRGPTGEVSATWRLLPTTGPNMLRDTFAHLLGERPVPCHPAIWETSRFAVETEAGDDEGLALVGRVTRELFCGLVEWGMANGVREIVAVYDVRIAKLHPRIGCRPKWRTKGQRMGNTIAMVGAFDLDEAVLSKMRARVGVTAPVLVTAAADAA